MRAEAPEPSIRGSYISPGKAWIQKVYGDELWEAALRAVPTEQQAIFRAELVSLAWYPLKHWTAVLDAVRANVLARTGESGATFDRRNLFESISGTMRTVYRIAFALLSPTTVVAKVTPYFKRVYSHGEYEVLKNEPGHCQIRFRDAPTEMLPELERSFPLATEWMLDVAGQRVTHSALTSHSGPHTFSCDLDIKYEPKKPGK
jgi:hypothetical protein